MDLGFLENTIQAFGPERTLPSGPIKYTTGMVRWYNSLGELHRMDGPAVTYTNGCVPKWYISGREFSEDEYYKLINSEEMLVLILKGS